MRNLVALHGGSVEAASDGPDRGSQFIVRLPADPSANRAERATLRPNAPSPATAARRILVVDDNRDAADLLAEALGLSGHSVQTAYDGPSAVNAARAFEPDLALLDLGLPLMDGYELAERLKQIPGLGAIQLVALTGYGQPLDRTRSKSAGFHEHLVKPAEVEKVAAVVETLNRRRSTRPPRAEESGV